jgi:general nucleoside transport system permease protein
MWTNFLVHLADPSFFATVLRVTTPILLAALGALISDRAGVLNIGIEGIMLAGAFTGVVISAFVNSAWAGLLAAVLVGCALASLLFAALRWLRSDLVLSGVALNLACTSATVLLLYALTGDKGMSGSLPSRVLPEVHLSFLKGLTIIGPIFASQHVLTWASLFAVPGVGMLLTYTRFGLRLRAVGENAEAAALAGVHVDRVRFAALAISGAFGGAAGAFLSMGYVSWFAVGMSAGRGFVAIAAEVMGGGGAVGTLLAALVLGSAQTLATNLQGVGLPSELLETLPYIVPVFALVLHRAALLSITPQL